MSEISERLSNTKTLSDLEKEIEMILPGWLVTSLEGYSPDYPQLTQNWTRICQEKFGVAPRRLLLVDRLEFGADATDMNRVCEFLTLNGFCVRRVAEFVACPVCEKAIPDRTVWNLLKTQNPLNVPSSWSPKCTRC
jgi:hypothetical protein